MDSEYIPNFKTAFQHFLVHTGGRAVIEEVEKKLSLAPADVQPSKETLFRYGNTCCAAVFYVLTNMEARVRARAAPRSCWELSVLAAQLCLLVCIVCCWSFTCLRHSVLHALQSWAGAEVKQGFMRRWCTWSYRSRVLCCPRKGHLWVMLFRKWSSVT